MTKPYPFEVGDFVTCRARHLRGKAFKITVLNEGDADHVFVVQVQYGGNWQVNHDEPGRRLLRSELWEICPNHPSGGNECHIVRKRQEHEGTRRTIA